MKNEKKIFFLDFHKTKKRDFRDLFVKKGDFRDMAKK